VRQLQVVGVSDDGEALILGPAGGKPSHRLRLDDKLRAAVRGQLTAVSKDRAESALTPKEMQARLREGATPEEVAKDAGVPVTRVLPYAAPVLAERERIVEQARAAVIHRTRGPNGQRPLGEVVDAHLSDTAGLKPESIEWSARRRRDGAWAVVLAYAARGGRRTASWLWRPVERDLTALDASASRLAAEEAPTPRRKAAKAVKKAPAKTAGRRPAARKAAAKKTGKKTAKRVAKPAAAPAKTVRAAKTAKAAPASKPARTARTARAARPVKVVKPAAPKKAVAPKQRAAAPAAPAKPARKIAKPRPTRAVRPVPDVAELPIRPTVVPDPVLEPVSPPIVVIARPEPEPEPEPQAEALPAALPEPTREPEQETGEEPRPIVARRPGQRVPLPSWSDVLLGVAPPEPTRDAATRRRRKSG